MLYSASKVIRWHFKNSWIFDIRQLYFKGDGIANFVCISRKIHTGNFLDKPLNLEALLSNEEKRITKDWPLFKVHLHWICGEFRNLSPLHSNLVTQSRGFQTHHLTSITWTKTGNIMIVSLSGLRALKNKHWRRQNKPRVWVPSQKQQRFENTNLNPRPNFSFDITTKLWLQNHDQILSHVSRSSNMSIFQVSTTSCHCHSQCSESVSELYML